MSDRYDRQERIPNWKQTALNDSYIAIVGSGPLAQSLGAVLAGLGIGNLRIYDNEILKKHSAQDFLCFEAKEGEKKAEAVKGLISKINPQINVDMINWKFLRHYFAEAVIGKPNAIVDCTNDPFQELILFCYGQAHNIPVINGASKKYDCLLSVKLPDKNFAVPEDFYLDSVTLEKVTRLIPESYLSIDYYNREQDGLTSLVCSGLIADEVRKIVMPLNEDEKPLQGSLNYSLLSQDRFSLNSLPTKEAGKMEYSKNKVVYVIGAGSIGNIVGLGLAVEGIKELVIFDDDTAEEVNLNRQILLYEGVGQPKATTLAKKLRQINPNINVEAVVGKFTPKTDYGKKPDLVMACTDSFKSRKIVNDYAKKYGIPIISGGTDFDSGQVISYAPGRSTCLNCQIGIDKAAEQEAQVEGCATAPEPSVIVSNWIIGSLMVAEASTVLNKDNPTINGRTVYDSKENRRLRVVKLEKNCQCHEEGKK
ncbi:ThiF family adenylyltransferase [Candidatus Woesearchaeota archaeon]|nr:ThiF family adenylyltransferase [Candidatus Woesearchaeota archaeon]